MREHRRRGHERGIHATDPHPVARLVVAPHADDEVLGCGGLLAKYHHESAVVVLAEPEAMRAAEFAAAQEILGYSTAYFLDLPDGSVGADMHGLVGALDTVLDRCRPRELYLPYPSVHQDHIAAYEAGIRAARLSLTPGHWFPPDVYVYDVAAYDLVLYPTDLRWNIFEALDEHHVDTKVKAAMSYGSQMVTGPHPVNDLKQCAQTIGAARRVEWAEQYALVRSVRDCRSAALYTGDVR
ncbi:MAG: PIG-L deacetylase family protein [Nocardioides sp.]|nr:PIG-L deacetylase family protein [Nocardioides sp.]